MALDRKDIGSSGSLLGELRHRVSKAAAMISMYGERANSVVNSEAELARLQEEMKLIKSEIVSELAHSRGLLKKMQHGGGL